MSQNKPQHIIVTRPSPGLYKTMGAIRALGWQAIASPSLVIKPLETTCPVTQPTSLIVTSKQAIAFIKEMNKERLVFAVGDATSRALKKNGFNRVLSASGNAKTLLQLLLKHKKQLGAYPVLACGYLQGDYLYKGLQGYNINLYRWYVYDSQASLEPSLEVLKMVEMGKVYGCLFFSKKSAQSWLYNVPRDIFNKILFVTISSNVTEAIRAMGFENIILTAKKPTHRAVIEALGTFS